MPDAATPNTRPVDVGGALLEQGVTLDAVPFGGAIRDGNLLSWIRQSDGALLASWTVFEDPTFDAGALAANSYGTILQTIIDGAGDVLARLTIDADDTRLQVGPFDVSLLNSGYGSDFAYAPGLAVTAGTTTISWAGGSGLSSATTVVHGIGRQPLAIVATPYQSFPIPVLATAAADTNAFQLSGQTEAVMSAGFTVSAGWIAIG